MRQGCSGQGLPSPDAIRNAVGLLAGERHGVGFAMEKDRWTSGEVSALSRQPGWVRIPHGLPQRGTGIGVVLQPSKLARRVRVSCPAPDLLSSHWD